MLKGQTRQAGNMQDLRSSGILPNMNGLAKQQRRDMHVLCWFAE
jgi:hypothetical protein